MNLFVTNDDGIDAPGLGPLAAALGRETTAVVVGAPDREMSGTGTSVYIPGRHREPIRISPHTIAAHPEVDAHAVTGTPALTVLLAHQGVFGERPEIVVAGPNMGANVGHDVHHSGTVGAALTAVKYGIHGVAASLAVLSENPRWDTAVVVTAELVEQIAKAGLEDPVLANLNIPDLPFEEVKGIRQVRLAQESSVRVHRFDERVNGDGSRELRPVMDVNTVPVDIGTDIGALRAGFATLTWLELPGVSRGRVSDVADVRARTSAALGLPA